MRIDKDETFLPVCGEHNCTLRGTPKLKHPNLHATAVWCFDLSDMHCTYNAGYNADDCKNTWEIRA